MYNTGPFSHRKVKVQEHLQMGFRQNFSGRRRHQVIAPAVLSLSRKHVDGWVTIISVIAVEMASNYSDWTIKQLKEELEQEMLQKFRIKG